MHRFAMQDQPRYDPVKSFTHVSYIGSVANVVVVHPSVSANTMKELVELAQAKPDTLNYGSYGNGSQPHLLFEMLRAETGAHQFDDGRIAECVWTSCDGRLSVSGRCIFHRCRRVGPKSCWIAHDCNL